MFSCFLSAIRFYSNIAISEQPEKEDYNYNFKMAVINPVTVNGSLGVYFILEVSYYSRLENLLASPAATFLAAATAASA